MTRSKVYDTKNVSNYTPNSNNRKQYATKNVFQIRNIVSIYDIVVDFVAVALVKFAAFHLKIRFITIPIL